MNLYASLLIIFTVTVRAAAMNKLPKKTFTVLWLIIISRLLIPYTMPSVIDVSPAVNTLNDVSGGRLISQIPQFPRSRSETVQPEIQNIQSENENVSDITENNSVPENKTINISVYSVIWLIGIFALSALFIAPHIIHSRKYRTALPIESEYINS